MCIQPFLRRLKRGAKFTQLAVIHSFDCSDDNLGRDLAFTAELLHLADSHAHLFGDGLRDWRHLLHDRSQFIALQRSRCQALAKLKHCSLYAASAQAKVLGSGIGGSEHSADVLQADPSGPQCAIELQETICSVGVADVEQLGAFSHHALDLVRLAKLITEGLDSHLGRFSRDSCIKGTFGKRSKTSADANRSNRWAQLLNDILKPTSCNASIRELAFG